MINTNKSAPDDSYPTFPPYRNGRAPEPTTKNISDMLVRALVELSSADKSQTGGVSVTQIKSFIKREFDKDMSSPHWKAKFSQVLNRGVEMGQFVKTSLGTGATGTVHRNITGIFIAELILTSAKCEREISFTNVC
jgi:linker histone H1 and H5 family